VTTWHNDINRTGWQQSESTLTPSALTTCTSQPCFGLLWQWSGLAPVYAQPLAVGNLPALTNCPAPCSAVFIATEDDTVYAFNAASDSQHNPIIWQTNVAQFLNGTAVDCSQQIQDFAPCQPIPDGGKVGITGTPVIDTSTNLLYAVGAIEMGGNVVEYDLFAVNILSGAVAGHVAISGTVTGKAPGTNCASSYGSGGYGPITFDPDHRQRAALLLLNNNMVYVAFAPGDPNETLNGWIFGYKFVPNGNSGTFSQVELFNSTPYGTGGGVWQSAAGLSAEVRQDGTTYIYAASGNGTFDLTGIIPTATDMGDTAMKFWVNTTTGALTLVDYYTPFNVNAYQPPNSKIGVCQNDADFGSGGVMVFPDAFYNGLNLSVVGDKQSNLYVLNRDNMGHFNAAGGNLVELSPIRYVGQYAPTGQGFWSTPAYWKYVDSGVTHYLLYSSVTSDDKIAKPFFPMDMYELATSGTSGPLPSAPTASSSTVFCEFSPTPVLSSSGTTAGTGVVWGVERPNTDNQFNPPYDCQGAVVNSAALHAFNANTMAELYTSRALTTLGSAPSFSSPTVFQSRVYLGTSTTVNVFGLCASYPGGCTH